MLPVALLRDGAQRAFELDLLDGAHSAPCVSKNSPTVGEEGREEGREGGNDVGRKSESKTGLGQRKAVSQSVSQSVSQAGRQARVRAHAHTRRHLEIMNALHNTVAAATACIGAPAASLPYRQTGKRAR